MKTDTWTVTVLPDGMVKIETDGVSQANHLSAENAIAEINRLLGGQTETVQKRKGHTHSHHGVAHTH